MKHLTLAFVIAMTAMACSTVDSGSQTASNEGQAQAECQTQEVMTGSHIARKRCVTKEQKKQEQRAAQEYLQHRPQTSSMPKGASGQ